VAETPDLQVYDLGHLGLVAGILDRIGLVSLRTSSTTTAWGGCWTACMRWG